MKTYKFKAETHEEYGSLGLRPLWYPHGEPFGGMGVAHDILEHFPNDEGEIEGELEAIGASLLLRGETGYYQHRGNVNKPHVHLASGVAEAWRYNVQRDNRTTVKPCQAVNDSTLLEKCWLIVNTAFNEDVFTDYGVEAPEHNICEHIVNWIAKGYKRAQQRFKNVDVFHVAYNIFKKIEKDVNDLLLEIDCEGNEVHVQVDMKNMTAKVYFAWEVG